MSQIEAPCSCKNAHDSRRGSIYASIVPENYSIITEAELIDGIDCENSL